MSKDFKDISDISGLVFFITIKYFLILMNPLIQMFNFIGIVYLIEKFLFNAPYDAGNLGVHIALPLVFVIGLGFFTHFYLWNYTYERFSNK